MIVSAADFDFSQVNRSDLIKRRPGRSKTGTRRYINLITAFDIETTTININGRDHAFMYIWQWQIGPEVTVIGRTWDEFLDFSKQLVDGCGDGVYIVVYVHNLSFEHHFISGIYHFKPGDVFATKQRTVLRCDMYDHLEFRCSMLQTNMSLRRFLAEMRVPDQKGWMDYKIKRYPWTEIGSETFSQSDLEYCVHDVRGLVQAMLTRMSMTGDNLATVPLTSTGYVRRTMKRELNKAGRMLTQDQQPTLPIYDMLVEAYRGGNTHANRYYAGRVNQNVHSVDRSSSYPDVICNCLFPGTAWSYYKGCTHDELLRLITKKNKAILFRAGFRNLRLRHGMEYWGFPYLTRSKAYTLDNNDTLIKGSQYIEDNGRIIQCEYAEFTLTDVDLRIMLKEYDWDEMNLGDVWCAGYRRLPQQLIDVTLDYYRQKTQLKDVPGQELNYALMKALLNAIYGCLCQSNVKLMDIFDDTYSDNLLECGPWKQERLPEDPDERQTVRAAKLADYVQKTPLVYAWGVWICAWARYRLEEGLLTVWEQDTPENPTAALYIDTDSIKYLGNVDFSAYNAARIDDSTRNGAYADDVYGNTHHMGVLEQEKDSIIWATLGAKKYCCVYKKEASQPVAPLRITIAGVNKALGGEELMWRAQAEASGSPMGPYPYKGLEPAYMGMMAFCETMDVSKYFEFKYAGGTEILYNDWPDVGTINIDGHELTITRNCVIRDSTYQLGVRGEYLRLLEDMILDLNQFAD